VKPKRLNPEGGEVERQHLALHMGKLDRAGAQEGARAFVLEGRRALGLAEHADERGHHLGLDLVDASAAAINHSTRLAVVVS